jgi:hypothetical protein
MEQAIEAGSPVLQRLKEVWRAMQEARRRRAQARAVALLDAHTLRDIGLEAHAEEQRRRALMHKAALRLGLY